MDTLLKISIFGAAVDVLPWFAYDISETGQKSMIRVIRIRTIVEDRNNPDRDEASYIEGCEAIIKARKYYGLEKMQVPHHSIITKARELPSGTPEEKAARFEAIKEARQKIEDAKAYNEEIEIADFVMRELNRFDTDFGKKQYELCKMIVDGGEEHFFEKHKEINDLARALPESDVKEERTWRKQEIKNAKQLERSEKLAREYYPRGVDYDPDKAQRAFDMPDSTREEAKIRRRAMKQANTEQNMYTAYASPYLAAVRTLDLYEGYKDLDSLISGYDSTVTQRKARLDAERAEQERLAAERKLEKERYEAEKKLKKKR